MGFWEILKDFEVLWLEEGVKRWSKRWVWILDLKFFGTSSLKDPASHLKSSEGISDKVGAVLEYSEPVPLY